MTITDIVELVAVVGSAMWAAIKFAVEHREALTLSREAIKKTNQLNDNVRLLQRRIDKHAIKISTLRKMSQKYDRRLSHLEQHI